MNFHKLSKYYRNNILNIIIYTKLITGFVKDSYRLTYAASGEMVEISLQDNIFIFLLQFYQFLFFRLNFQSIYINKIFPNN